jgi:hypothetical protein
LASKAAGEAASRAAGDFWVMAAHSSLHLARPRM